MKKLLAILLCAVMTLCLVACGEEKTENQINEETNDVRTENDNDTTYENVGEVTGTEENENIAGDINDKSKELVGIWKGAPSDLTIMDPDRGYVNYQTGAAYKFNSDGTWEYAFMTDSRDADNNYVSVDDEYNNWLSGRKFLSKHSRAYSGTYNYDGEIIHFMSAEAEKETEAQLTGTSLYIVWDIGRYLYEDGKNWQHVTLIKDSNQTYFDTEGTVTSTEENDTASEFDADKFIMAVQEKIWDKYNGQIYASDGTDEKKENNLSRDVFTCIMRAYEVTMNYGGNNTDLEYYIVGIALYMGEDGIVLSSCTSNEAVDDMLAARISSFNSYASFGELMEAINNNTTIKEIIDYALLAD